jgi:hypothetical protein
VGVKNVEGLHQKKLPKLYNPVRGRGVMCRQRKHAQAFLVCALLQQAVFPTNDELLVAAVPKAGGKQ